MVKVMTYLLGKATVEDFEEWKSKFHEFDSYRTEHGQLGYQVFQSETEPDEVVVLFDWDDDENPTEFFESKGMRERLGEAGVKGRPDFTELELVDKKSTRQSA